ncbi:MAG: hypothetical protein AB1546_16190 [bacterium]
MNLLYKLSRNGQLDLNIVKKLKDCTQRAQRMRRERKDVVGGGMPCPCFFITLAESLATTAISLRAVERIL